MPLKRVVIVGGGFAGLAIAKKLDSDKSLKVTIIDKRDFLLVKHGALRAAVTGGVWEERTKMPVAALFKRVERVRAVVESVDEANKTLKLRVPEGEVIEEPFAWDVLIIATGSRSLSPAEPTPSRSSTEADFRAYYEATRSRLNLAKHVVVVGSGPVAIELCGEILDSWDPKAIESGKRKLSLCVGDHDLLDRANPAVPKGAAASIARVLRSRGARILKRGEDLVEPALPKATVEHESPFVETPHGVTLTSGVKLHDVDLIVFAFGSRPVTNFVPISWTDAVTQEIKVSSTLQSLRRDDVFAIGDAAQTGYTKLAGAVWADADVLAANVSSYFAGKPLGKRIRRSGSTHLYVSLGKNHGRIFTPWFFGGNRLVSLIKGNDLAVQMIYSNYGGGRAPSIGR